MCGGGENFMNYYSLIFDVFNLNDLGGFFGRILVEFGSNFSQICQYLTIWADFLVNFGGILVEFWLNLILISQF